LRIVYGNPGPELGAAAARGEIALGGDVLFGGEPEWKCRGCGHEFGLFAGFEEPPARDMVKRTKK
jgi:hypothetical protein